MVSAQETWNINSFDSNIAIQNDGKVHVIENISVDFQTERHGIYRDIPYVYNTDNKLYTAIQIQGVLRDGKNEKYDIQINDSYIRVKVGDANRTITGSHTYTIEYITIGVLASYADHDEFYWNATGNNWGVPIDKATARVILAKGQITKAACFIGDVGATDPCTFAQISPNEVSFKSEFLSLHQGLTIVSAFPKGTFPILIVEKPKSLIEQLLSPLGIGIFIGTILIGLIFILHRWYSVGRDFWHKNIPFATGEGERKPLGSHETVVVSFEPPQRLRPAEIGVLMDERADTLDVTATIIDLATRGYLTISEISKKWLFGTTDYLLSKKTKDEKELLGYEKELIKRLFETGDEVKMSELKTKFYDDLKVVKDKLYDTVVEKKLFTSDPEKTRTSHLVAGMILIFLVIFIFTLLPKYLPYYIFSVLSGIGVIGIIVILFSRIMPRRSAKGRDLYLQARGYYRFISGAESYRQQFFEKKNMFNEILPYAIVFGLTKKFAQAMQDMGIKSQQPTWYIGAHPFSTTVFSSSLNDFSNSFSSAMVSSPKGSGFSSGGGFSGGGFGGGGGGSW